MWEVPSQIPKNFRISLKKNSLRDYSSSIFCHLRGILIIFRRNFRIFWKKRYWIPWVIQQKSPGKTSEINLWEISEGSSGQISDTIFEGGLQWIPKKILEPCTRIAGDIFEGIPERLPEKISKVSSKISLRNCSGIARIVLWLILFFFFRYSFWYSSWYLFWVFLGRSFWEFT